MKPFRDRDPVRIGAAGLLALGLAVMAGFRAGDLPLIGGDTYYAEFTELGGLSLNDPVRVAGVRVGKVTVIELVDARVRVGFDIDDSRRLGTETTAAVKVDTLLGAMYLSIEPDGAGAMDEGDTIPISRTTSAFDVVDAFTGIAERSDAIDTDQLAASLRTLADLTRNTPEEFRSALRGVSDLSQVIATRDEELESLLDNLGRVSDTLAARDEDIVALMKDADALFRALLQRRSALHRLLVATSRMSRELTSLVEESRADLTPALERLDAVVAVLNKNEENLDEGLALLAPFYRMFASVTANGPWLDGYVFNLPPVPSPQP